MIKAKAYYKNADDIHTKVEYKRQRNRSGTNHKCCSYTTKETKEKNL